MVAGKARELQTFRIWLLYIILIIVIDLDNSHQAWTKIQCVLLAWL